jgi:hypothetical protein
VNDIASPIISIDLSDGSKFRFDSFDELSAWLEKELAAFRWLVDGGPQAGPALLICDKVLSKQRACRPA